MVMHAYSIYMYSLYKHDNDLYVTVPLHSMHLGMTRKQGNDIYLPKSKFITKLSTTKTVTTSMMMMMI